MKSEEVAAEFAADHAASKDPAARISASALNHSSISPSRCSTVRGRRSSCVIRGASKSAPRGKTCSGYASPIFRSFSQCRS